MGGLGEFGALFNPGMRHELEERRAKQMLREEEGTGRKGRMGIDLDSGVALIPGRESAGRADRADDADDADTTDADVSDAHADASDATDDHADSTAADSTDTGAGDRNGTQASGDRSGDRSGRGAAGQREDRAATTDVRRLAVPAGKARRGASGNTTPGTPSPAGKARRTRS